VCEAVARYTDGTAEIIIAAAVVSSAAEEISRQQLSDLAVLVTGHCPSVDLQVLLSHSACAHRLHSHQETR